MRQSHHTESEILHLLVEAHAGLPVAEVCRNAQISARTFYRWRSRYGGITPSAAREVKDLQLEVRRLRSLVATLSARPVEERVRTRPLAGAPAARQRPEQGGTVGPDMPPSAPAAGATLGRFAFVRGRR